MKKTKVFYKPLLMTGFIEIDVDCDADGNPVLSPKPLYKISLENGSVVYTYRASDFEFISQEEHA